MGVVLTGPDGTRVTLGQRLPGCGCNNQAELQALHVGLQMALQHHAGALRIYTDSQWLQQQLAMPVDVASNVRMTARLLPHLTQTREVLAMVPQVQWRWVPRRCNAEADALARAAALQLLPQVR